MEGRESLADYTVNTRRRGAILPGRSLQHMLSCNVVTARGFAPGYKMPRTFDPRRGQIGKYFPTFSPLEHRDTSTTTSTIIIITITTTTLHKCILNTCETGEKRWCRLSA
ncbi:hypothetical protein VZT92_015514 [Zoarces viviparus]|uniref:Uncharacterized protein n=1 Tax=Zoarces viviparus TaxID=48416 RepID=A0AAW1EX72_ZOAVI